MINQEEITELSKRVGDVRGAVFQTDADFIRREIGEDGLLKIEKKITEWGAGLKYNQVKTMNWYPVAWRTFSLLACCEVFGWNEAQIRRMGLNAPKASIIVKLFFKLFPDMKKFAAQIPAYWKKHYSVGELTPVKVDMENKEIILHLSEFAFHPIQCRYYEGYFEATVKLTRPKDSQVSSKEISCSFREKNLYEVYQLNWTT